MKLRRMLIIVFLTLTLTPIVIVSVLLYQSGYKLAKESYVRNLRESISVQADYIEQTISNDMILDNRFAKQNKMSLLEIDNDESFVGQSDLFKSYQSYLETTGDRIAISLLLDKENNPIYTIGEAKETEIVKTNLPELETLKKQSIVEFELTDEVYSLGIITPMFDNDDNYIGSLISIYDHAYLFKIISSYYKIANTSSYICRENGDAVSFKEFANQDQEYVAKNTLSQINLESNGEIDEKVKSSYITGYYRNVTNTPWYLVGFVDYSFIRAFANQYIFAYGFIIIGVVIVDILLAIYFSHRVVSPINNLIYVIEGYPKTITDDDVKLLEKSGYAETRYLSTKFLELMKRILLVQHNYEGVSQLYQSANMSDTNIDIDTRQQTISSNKDIFQKIMSELVVPEGACIVERFIHCFSSKDQAHLMNVFVNMRDNHLSTPCEAEVYMPHLGEKWFHALIVPMYENDSLSHLFIQLRDISGFKKQELESNEEARKDPLTGLYNRLGFTHRVEQVVSKEGTIGNHAILFLDMDYFKMVNDNLGHNVGDELLRSVAKILNDTIGDTGIASRHGGDEFAVFIPNTTKEDITKLVDELHKQLLFPFKFDDESFAITASIGISYWNQDATSLEELLVKADKEMYLAKKRVKQGN